MGDVRRGSVPQHVWRGGRLLQNVFTESQRGVFQNLRTPRFAKRGVAGYGGNKLPRQVSGNVYGVAVKDSYEAMMIWPPMVSCMAMQVPDDCSLSVQCSMLCTWPGSRANRLSVVFRVYLAIIV
jgi:hypothetical protein